MALPMPEIVPVFQNRLISGGSLTVTSDPVQARGNKLVMCATVTNLTGGGGQTLTLSLDVSGDGQNWKDSGAGTSAATAFGYMTEITLGPAGAMFYPLVRIRAVASGTTPSALFDASLAFSYL